MINAYDNEGNSTEIINRWSPTMQKGNKLFLGLIDICLYSDH